MTLPYGIFSYDIASPRVGVLVDEHILDLEIVGLLGFFNDLPLDPAVFAKPVLNDFMALDKAVQRAVRDHIIELLTHPDAKLEAVHNQVFIHRSRVQMHLPVRVGDYTDFYAGIHHATNVGRMFRPEGDPLLPNYRHLPVAYHGRASSIVVSGTPIRRPQGQFPGPDQQPVFGPSKALDFELELGIVIGKPSVLGQPVPVELAEDHIFGFVLFNDWSARDIQRWEYQPLGPFLGKNFGSSISAWVVPMEAFEPFRVEGPVQEPTPLPYLRTSGQTHFGIDLEVALSGPGSEETIISRSNTRHLYWSPAQMIAHHTVNGCNLNTGDILATGTISGTEPNSYGSLLELTWNGKQPLTLPDGTTRTFLQDGDTVIMRGMAVSGDQRIELGEVSGTIGG
ncbi:fumarylacetoacetase [Tellurirhabdus rosea]|uniref:fumarylacetoacetase n=1 Tax=Tellurirhabdus rosea TaxID=2674997 RepID=UPI0022536425|nr:fumarylacetoacetase [Tellurirhabdus rosea]